MTTIHTSKASATNAFNLLSLDRMNELLRLNDMIFTPDADLLLNATFIQMVDKAHDLADVHFPSWTDRSKADFGEFLVELMALFSEKDFVYANALMLESYIHTATKFSSVYMFATSRCGYEPKLTKGSRHNISISFTAIEDGRIPFGAIVLQSGDFKYTLAQDVDCKAGSNTIVAKFIGGLFDAVSATYTGRGIRVPFKNTDIYDMRVFVDGVPYSRVSSFNGSTDTDKHFISVPENEGECSIHFGRGGFGLQPAVGSSINIQAIHDCSLTSKNIGGLSTFSTTDSNISNVTATSVSVTFNGQEQESLVDAKRNAFAYFTTQGNIINKSDLLKTLLQYPGVLKASAMVLSNLFTFYVILKDGYDEGEYITYLETEIDSMNIIEGFVIGGDTTTQIPISVDMRVFVSPGFNNSTTMTLVKAWLSNYTDPLLDGQYGRGFKINETIAGIISSVPGVTNVIYDDINGAAAADVVIDSHRILAAIDWEVSTIELI